MRLQRSIARKSTFMLSLMTAAAALAQDYDLSWRTIDGGGQMFSTGDTLELSGTTGQPDAAILSGGSLELIGGFWAVTASSTAACPCPGEFTGDGQRNGVDIQGFVDCLLGASGDCACAEIDGTPGVDGADVSAFVVHLLSDSDCP